MNINILYEKIKKAEKHKYYDNSNLERIKRAQYDELKSFLNELNEYNHGIINYLISEKIEGILDEILIILLESNDENIFFEKISSMKDSNDFWDTPDYKYNKSIHDFLDNSEFCCFGSEFNKELDLYFTHRHLVKDKYVQQIEFFIKKLNEFGKNYKNSYNIEYLSKINSEEYLKRKNIIYESENFIDNINLNKYKKITNNIPQKIGDKFFKHSLNLLINNEYNDSYNGYDVYHLYLYIIVIFMFSKYKNFSYYKNFRECLLESLNYSWYQDYYHEKFIEYFIEKSKLFFNNVNYKKTFSFLDFSKVQTYYYLKEKFKVPSKLSSADYKNFTITDLIKYYYNNLVKRINDKYLEIILPLHNDRKLCYENLLDWKILEHFNIEYFSLIINKNYKLLDILEKKYKNRSLDDEYKYKNLKNNILSYQDPSNIIFDYYIYNSIFNNNKYMKDGKCIKPIYIKVNLKKNILKNIGLKEKYNECKNIILNFTSNNKYIYVTELPKYLKYNKYVNIEDITHEIFSYIKYKNSHYGFIFIHSLKIHIKIVFLILYELIINNS